MTVKIDVNAKIKYDSMIELNSLLILACIKRHETHGELLYIIDNVILTTVWNGCLYICYTCILDQLIYCKSNKLNGMSNKTLDGITT